MENVQKNCKFCNERIDAKAIKCKHCGSMQEDYEANQSNSTRNGLGITGFVLSLLGLIFCWVPFVNLLLLIPGFLLSFIGIFVGIGKRRSIGHSIAGLILSIIAFVLIFAFLSAYLASHSNSFGRYNY